MYRLVDPVFIVRQNRNDSDMKKTTLKTFSLVLAGALWWSAESTAAPFIEGFEDIPIPQGMTQTESDNISFGNEETRLVEAYLTGSKTQFKDVEAFYMNTLPQLGWTFQGKQGNAISFYRDGEKLDIVREQKSPLLVRITIKSQN